MRQRQHQRRHVDDAAHVPADAAFHEVLRVLAEALPQGLSLIVLSRSEPPAAYARLRLNEALRLLEAPELNLTADEARQLAAARETGSRPASTPVSSIAGWHRPTAGSPASRCHCGRLWQRRPRRHRERPVGDADPRPCRGARGAGPDSADPGLPRRHGDAAGGGVRRAAALPRALAIGPHGQRRPRRDAARHRPGAGRPAWLLARRPPVPACALTGPGAGVVLRVGTRRHRRRRFVDPCATPPRHRRSFLRTRLGTQRSA